MTDDRDTTIDAIKYLRGVLDTYRAMPATVVDTSMLSLALVELDASRRARAKLEAIVREMLPHLEWTARFDEDQAALVKRARELVGGKVHDEL